MGLLVPAYSADEVLLLDWTANLVGDVKMHTHLPWIGRDSACKPHGIFARHDGLRNLVDLTGKRIRVAIEQQPFPRAHPQDGPCAFLTGMLPDHRGPQIFVEHTTPLSSDS